MGAGQRRRRTGQDQALPVTGPATGKTEMKAKRTNTSISVHVFKQLSISKRIAAIRRGSLGSARVHARARACGYIYIHV